MTSLHDADCRFERTPWVEVGRAYVGIVSVPAGGLCDGEALRHEMPGEQGPLQQAALRRLKRDERVSDMGPDVLRLRAAEKFREEVSKPTRKPVRTLHQYGSIPGCHDNAVFAMVAWCEMVGLSWSEMCENVVSWFRNTGVWNRDGFGEATPTELAGRKCHVYETGYGWKEKAVSVRRVIDRYCS